MAADGWRRKKREGIIAGSWLLAQLVPLVISKEKNVTQ